MLIIYVILSNGRYMLICLVLKEIIFLHFLNSFLYQYSSGLPLFAIAAFTIEKYPNQFYNKEQYFRASLGWMLFLSKGCKCTKILVYTQLLIRCFFLAYDHRTYCLPFQLSCMNNFHSFQSEATKQTRWGPSIFV